MSKTFLSLFFGLPIFAACTFSNKTSRINDVDVDQYSYSRRYVEGKQFKTELKNAEVDPETGKDVQWAVAEFTHNVLEESTNLFERISLESPVIQGKLVEGHEVINRLPVDGVTPFQLQLGKGISNLKFTGDPIIIGAMSDLATFYNALNIEHGATRVTSPASSVFHALNLIRPTISNLEDKSNPGFQLLTYESCLEYSIQMVALDTKTATYRSVFSPPAQNCLAKPAFSWMEIPENGFNFQHVMKLPGGNYIVQWGSEKFITDIVVDRDNGRIQSAKFGENFLRGKRWFCPGSLEKCTEISSNFFHSRNVNLRSL